MDDSAKPSIDDSASPKPTINRSTVSVADPATTEELSEFVQFHLTEMQKKLQNMTDQIMGRIDQLGSRIQDLERNMNDLIEAVEVNEPNDREGGSKTPTNLDGRRLDRET